MIGGLELRALHHELVDSKKMTEREFHDGVLQGGPMPIAMVRARLAKTPLTRDWRGTVAIRRRVAAAHTCADEVIRVVHSARIGLLGMIGMLAVFAACAPTHPENPALDEFPPGIIGSDEHHVLRCARPHDSGARDGHATARAEVGGRFVLR